MTDTQPTRQARAVEGRSLPNRVTGRLRTAIEQMVWSAACRADAAIAAGMTDHSLRAALRKPHVMGYLQAELRVLRESERPKTHGRLCELRDQDSNMNAAVAAAKALEQISDDQAMRPNAANPTPGITIRLINVNAMPAPPSPIVDVTPFSPAAPVQLTPPAIDPIFKLP